MDDPVDFREYQKPGPESAFDYTRDMFFAVASIFISSIIIYGVLSSINDTKFCKNNENASLGINIISVLLAIILPFVLYNLYHNWAYPYPEFRDVYLLERNGENYKANLMTFYKDGRYTLYLYGPQLPNMFMSTKSYDKFSRKDLIGDSIQFVNLVPDGFGEMIWEFTFIEKTTYE